LKQITFYLIRLNLIRPGTLASKKTGHKADPALNLSIDRYIKPGIIPRKSGFFKINLVCQKGTTKGD